jgi:hypothetical protein
MTSVEEYLSKANDEYKKSEEELCEDCLVKEFEVVELEEN